MADETISVELAITETGASVLDATGAKLAAVSSEMRAGFDAARASLDRTTVSMSALRDGSEAVAPTAAAVVREFDRIASVNAVVKKAADGLTDSLRGLAGEYGNLGELTADLGPVTSGLASALGAAGWKGVEEGIEGVIGEFAQLGTGAVTLSGALRGAGASLSAMLTSAPGVITVFTASAAAVYGAAKAFGELRRTTAEANEAMRRSYENTDKQAEQFAELARRAQLSSEEIERLGGSFARLVEEAAKNPAGTIATSLRDMKEETAAASKEAERLAQATANVSGFTTPDEIRRQAEDLVLVYRKMAEQFGNTDAAASQLRNEMDRLTTIAKDTGVELPTAFRELPGVIGESTKAVKEHASTILNEMTPGERALAESTRQLAEEQQRLWAEQDRIWAHARDSMTLQIGQGAEAAGDALERLRERARAAAAQMEADYAAFATRFQDVASAFDIGGRETVEVDRTTVDYASLFDRAKAIKDTGVSRAIQNALSEGDISALEDLAKSLQSGAKAWARYDTFGGMAATAAIVEQLAGELRRLSESTQHRAGGGGFGSGLLMVGEQGPELIASRESGQVIDSGTLREFTQALNGFTKATAGARRAQDGGGGGTFTIVWRGREIAELIDEERDRGAEYRR